MENIIKILILEDDRNYLLTIEKYIALNFKDVSILKAENITTAIRIIHNEKPCILVCDYHLPDGNGLDFIKKIRDDNDLKDTYVILFSAIDDKDIRSKAYKSNIDDFIKKPFDLEQFIAKMNSAIRLKNLQWHIKNENSLLIKLAEELEKELQDIIKLSVKFLQARIPSSFDMLKRVAAASVWIAQTYGDLSKEDIRDIEISAFLSQAGRIFLPDNLLKVPVMTAGSPTDPIMHQVPVSGAEIVSSVRRFKNVSNYIKHVYENFDGSGIPERLKSWQIPFASRIIRVALDYEEYRTFQKKNASISLEMVKRESQRLYDNRVVLLMEQYVKSNENELKIENEIALNLMELKPNMTTTRDVYTEKGLKLIPAGVRLTESTISKIINIATTDSILGYVYVKI